VILDKNVLMNKGTLFSLLLQLTVIRNIARIPANSCLK